MTFPDPPAQPPVPQAAYSPPRTSRRHTITTATISFLAGAAAVTAAWTTTSILGNDSGPPRTSKEAQAAAADAEPATFDLLGEFTLTEGAISDGMEGCEGTGGFEDIALGTSVTVYDAAGTIIATDALVLSEYDGAGSCTFDVSVSNVPAGQDFYQVEISHRGKIQLSAEEAKAGQFAGTLG